MFIKSNNTKLDVMLGQQIKKINTLQRQSEGSVFICVVKGHTGGFRLPVKTPQGLGSHLKTDDALRDCNGDKRYASLYFLLPGLMSDAPAGLFFATTKGAELCSCRGSNSTERAKSKRQNRVTQSHFITSHLRYTDCCEAEP